jgi:hypothetical protein
MTERTRCPTRSPSLFGLAMLAAATAAVLAAMTVSSFAPSPAASGSRSTPHPEPTATAPPTPFAGYPTPGSPWRVVGLIDDWGRLVVDGTPAPVVVRTGVCVVSTYDDRMTQTSCFPFTPTPDPTQSYPYH